MSPNKDEQNACVHVKQVNFLPLRCCCLFYFLSQSSGPNFSSTFSEEERFTVFEAQGCCFHSAGCEGCGYRTGWTQLPLVVHSSRTWEGQHQGQTNDHLDRKKRKINKIQKILIIMQNVAYVKLHLTEETGAYSRHLGQAGFWHRSNDEALHTRSCRLHWELKEDEEGTREVWR